MAQSVFLNTTADLAASRKVDGSDHVHSTVGGTSASGSLTVSYDPAVITTLTIFDSCVRSARLRAVSAGLK